MHILYVEDHEDTSHVIGKMLQSMGHLVSLAMTCTDARQILERERIDLLISDLSLPDGDGCELMREVAARFRIPGIAVSGYAQSRDVDDARRAGFCEFLVKPLFIPQLQTTLQRVMLRS